MKEKHSQNRSSCYSWFILLSEAEMEAELRKYYSVRSENGIGRKKNKITTYSQYSNSEIVPQERIVRSRWCKSCLVMATCAVRRSYFARAGLPITHSGLPVTRSGSRVTHVPGGAILTARDCPLPAQERPLPARPVTMASSKQ